MLALRYFGFTQTGLFALFCVSFASFDPTKTNLLTLEVTLKAPNPNDWLQTNIFTCYFYSHYIKLHTFIINQHSIVQTTYLLLLLDIANKRKVLIQMFYPNDANGP